MTHLRLLLLACCVLLAGCAAPAPQGNEAPPPTSTPTAAATSTPLPTTAPPTAPPTDTPDPATTTAPTSAQALADVLAVEVSGTAQDYRFAVEIASPDTGCEQYADWWEVVSTEGELLHRRILAHSHVDEQPFVRSGGPVAIDPDTVVWVRAHMHPGGYGGVALRGSVQDGFAPAEPPPGFAADLAEQAPLPGGCAF